MQLFYILWGVVTTSSFIYWRRIRGDTEWYGCGLTMPQETDAVDGLACRQYQQRSILKSGYNYKNCAQKFYVSCEA